MRSRTLTSSSRFSSVGTIPRSQSALSISKSGVSPEIALNALATQFETATIEDLTEAELDALFNLALEGVINQIDD